MHEGEPRQGQPEALQRVAENVALVNGNPGAPAGRADINRVNGRAVGASIFVRVTKGLSLCHIAINMMKVWRNELKTSVNVINVTFYLG